MCKTIVVHAPAARTLLGGGGDHSTTFASAGYGGERLGPHIVTPWTSTLDQCIGIFLLQ